MPSIDCGYCCWRSPLSLQPCMRDMFETALALPVGFLTFPLRGSCSCHSRPRWHARTLLIAPLETQWHKEYQQEPGTPTLMVRWCCCLVAWCRAARLIATPGLDSCSLPATTLRLNFCMQYSGNGHGDVFGEGAAKQCRDCVIYKG